MTISMTSKAQTLIQLAPVITRARVAPIATFSFNQWQSSKQQCLKHVQEVAESEHWIVRSSCTQEDQASQSNAGAFHSELGVTPSQLENAINTVFDSYPTPIQGDEEILIQPMLENVQRAGVAFSHDPNSGSPYRIINWHEGISTTAVTSGQDAQCWQQAAIAKSIAPAELSPVLDLLDELLTLFGQQPLDVEFAVTANNQKQQLWLLQVRPLMLAMPTETPQQQFERLSSLEDKLTTKFNPHPFLCGKRTLFGVMPDWNPAEIIGIRPKPLALSLYRELVTDSIWAYQRHNYGYRNLRSFPLMHHFYGLPYIDVRVSFNSFIPAELDTSLADRLVDYYIDRLTEEPRLHDKIEFEIVLSCYSLDLPERLTELRKKEFSASDCQSIAQHLRQLTNNIIHPHKGLWLHDAEKLTKLRQRRETLENSELAKIERIYWLLEDAKRYGTLPFAGLARAGFIAIQMLKSLVNTGILSTEDYDAFLASTNTISRQLNSDKQQLDKTLFINKYGHLRPGTYDILSPRYDEMAEQYFDWSEGPAHQSQEQPFSLTLKQMRMLREALQTQQLDIEPIALLDFMQRAIELREQAKFEFSRNLSDCLNLVCELGRESGICPEDMAFVDIQSIKELHIGACSTSELLRQSVSNGKARYRDTSKVSLPPLICGTADIWGFQWPQNHPNFITQKRVTAEVTSSTEKQNLSGRIVFITNADPGFDWLFSHPIAGLITAWGGANSHMAIRAGELGLPAVIGAGELLYQQWQKAKTLQIDCAEQRVQVIG